VRGVTIDDVQQLRGQTIRNILCNGRARIETDKNRAQDVLADYERRGIIEWDADDLMISDQGLPYARHVAAQFDSVRGAI
jgi:oxygen-independent coproporphyrinogen-3 oxidase